MGSGGVRQQQGPVSELRINVDDQWELRDFVPRLCVNRSWPAGASGDITEMDSYVASVVTDVLRKRREMDDLEAKTLQRKLVRINTD